MPYSKTELEFLRNEYDKVKKEAINYSNKDKEAKKDFIFRLKRKAEVLFEAEGRSKKELASYILNDLEEYDFSISRSYYFSLFSEDEKGNYSKEFGSEHTHIFELEEDIEKCQCGVIKFNGLLYNVIQEEKIEERPSKALKPSNETNDPYSNPVTEYYQRVSENARELASMADSLVNKYYEDVDTAKLLEDNLPNLNLAIKEQKSLEAELIALSKQMDYRIRIGHFEKIKALLFEKTTKYGIAGIAGLLAPPCIKCGHKGITPKHMSANLMRKDREDILKKLMWFRTIDFNVNGKIIVVDVNDWFNKQVERAELNLDIEAPILVSYVAT